MFRRRVWIVGTVSQQAGSKPDREARMREGPREPRDEDDDWGCIVPHFKFHRRLESKRKNRSTTKLASSQNRPDLLNELYVRLTCITRCREASKNRMHTPGSHQHSTAPTTPRVALSSPKQRSTYPEPPSPRSTSTLDLFAYGLYNCPGLLMGCKRLPADRLSLREYQASPCGPSDHWALGYGYPHTLFPFASPLCATRHYRDNPTSKGQPGDKGCLNSFHPDPRASQAHIQHHTLRRADPAGAWRNQNQNHRAPKPQ